MATRDARVARSSSWGSQQSGSNARCSSVEAMVSGTVVDPTSTLVDSVPETHVMTDSEGQRVAPVPGS